MFEKVQQFINRNQLITSGSTIVVGVSGGPDSLALLHLLHRMKEKYALTIVAASVDHMFRGKESFDELQFVAQYCQSLSIPFEGKRINVPEYQRKTKESTQIAARSCRFAYFKEVMEKYDAELLALAHHGDDQIETMLMRQVRGGFGASLAGIQPRRPFLKGEVIRPLLSVTKDEIIRYCVEHNLKPRLDPSNEGDTYARNRFRHHVLPFLKKENPRVHERYQYLSKMMTEDDSYLYELAEEKMQHAIVRKDEKEMTVSRNVLVSLPLPLQRRMIHLILNYLYRKIPSSLTSVHIENTLYMLDHEHPSATLHLPLGLSVIRSYQELIFTFHSQKRTDYEYVLNIPGQVYLPSGMVVEACRRDELPKNPRAGQLFVCDANEIVPPFIVRTRRNGDRMSLMGMEGTKKLKDIFINHKIPRADRDAWPVITDGEGTILWLPELKKSAAAVTERRDHEYIVLRIKNHDTSRRNNRDA